jgi:hypothetical protein
VRAEGGTWRRDVALEAVGVWAVVSALYVATLSGNHSETEDALNYASRIRDDPHSDAPHLSFDWFGWAAYHVARGLGLTQESLRPIQVMNALVGAGAVAMLWFVLRRADQRRLVAFTACGVLACSYGFWWNNVEGEVYALSAFTIVICLTLAWQAVERPSWQRFAVLGAANGVAVLAHLQNVYFAGVAAVALLLAWRGGGLRSWWKSGLAYVAGATAVVVPAFAIAAAVLQLGSVRAFHAWFTVTTGDGQYGNVSAAMIPKGVVAAGRALVGGHFLLSFDAVERAFAARFPHRPLVEEFFFLQGYSTVVALVLLGLSAVVAASVLVLVASWLRRVRLDPGGRILALLCVAWIISYLPMLLYWDPFNTELWYVVWIPAAVLLALPLGTSQSLVPARFVAPVAVVLVGGMLVVNLLGSVWPQHDTSKDYWQVRTAWYRANATPDDLILSLGYVESGYLNYLSGADVLDVDVVFSGATSPQAAVSKIESVIRKSGAARVYVSDQVFHPFADTSAGCETVGASCTQSKFLRAALLGRSDIVANTRLERVYELSRDP